MASKTPSEREKEAVATVNWDATGCGKNGTASGDRRMQKGQYCGCEKGNGLCWELERTCGDPSRFRQFRLPGESITRRGGLNPGLERNALFNQFRFVSGPGVSNKVAERLAWHREQSGDACILTPGIAAVSGSTDVASDAQH